MRPGQTGAGKAAALVDRLASLLIDRFCLGAAVVALAAALAVVAAQVVFRYGLGNSIIWSEEFARFALIWSAFLGASVAYRRGEHVGVTLLLDRLPGSLARLLASVTHLITIAFAALVAWEGWHLTMRVFDRGEVANAIRVEIAWIYLAVPIGALFLGIAALAALLRLASGPDASPTGHP